MKQNTALYERLYSFVLAFLLCGGGALYFNTRFGMQINELLLLFAVAIFLTLVQVFALFKRYVVVTAAFIGAFLVALVIVLAAAFPVGGEAMTLFEWWFFYAPGNMYTYRFDYALLTTAIYIVLGGLASYFLQKLLALRVITAAAVIGALVFLNLMEEPVHWVLLFFAVVYLAAVLVEVCYRIARQGKRQQSSRSVAFFLLPVVLVVSFVTSILPQGEQPLNWSFVIDAVQSIHWEGSPFGGGGGEADITNFTEEYTGASGKLGGNLMQREGTAFLIDGAERGDKIYLSGFVRDTYTGGEWQTNAVALVQDYPEYMLEGYEFSYALGRYSPNGPIETRMNRRYAGVYYSDINTQAVFLPSKMISSPHISVGLGDDGLYTDISSVTYSTALGTQFYEKYNDVRCFVEYLEPKYDDENFVSFVNEQIGYVYEAGQEAIDFSRDNYLRDVSGLEEMLATRRDWIHKNYTDLPENLPDRVRELTEEITQGHSSNYDKLKAIERYLRSNYTYTTTPGTVPEGQDFVDYFLFEKQEGYCVYFASAMAVMARSIGIPTRYVGGFAITCEERNSEDYFEIDYSDAHAWPEAYLDGVGWIPFEPTAPYVETRYSGAENNVESSDSDESEETSDSSSSESEEDSLTDSSEVVEPTPDERVEQTTSAVIYIVVAVVVAAVLFVAFLLLHSRYRKRKYWSTSPPQRIDFDFKDVLLLLEAWGYAMQPGETLAAYTERLGAHLKQHIGSFAEAADIYSRQRYHREEGTEQDAKLIRQVKLALYDEVRKQISPVRFLAVRFKVEIV